MRRSALSAAGAGLLLIAATAAPASAESTPTDEDWMRLSVTGEAPSVLYEAIDSLHGTQTDAEIALLSEVPSYTIAYEDGTVAGLPFPDGTSLPELVSDGLVANTGEVAPALAERLDLSAAWTEPSPDPATITGPNNCIGNTNLARTYRTFAGKTLCEAWGAPGSDLQWTWTRRPLGQQAR